MKSIKPGRGPSGMSAIGSLIAIVFGIFWTMMVSSMGAPSFFTMFGVLFIILGIVQFLYHLKNATSKNRFSILDVTDSNEESDPFAKDNKASQTSNTIKQYCPYCGNTLNSDYEYCPNCGKKI